MINRIAPIIVIAALSVPIAGAVTGTAVSISYHKPLAYTADDIWSSVNVVCQGGKLVRYRIAADAITGTDTLYHGIAEHPTLDFTGSRVAFFAAGLRIEWQTNFQNAPGWHVVSGTQTNPNYLLMMNIDGSGLCTLQTFTKPLYPSATSGYLDGPVMDWPAGDFIYYEAPTKSAKVYKININNRQSTLVFDYSTPTNGPFLRRFSLNAVASLNAIQGLYCHDNQPQYILCFPAINCTWPCIQKTECCCNISLSASGRYYALYGGGEHEICYVNKWSAGSDWWGNATEMRAMSVTNLASWSGFNVTAMNKAGGYYIRWATNSDKWVMQEIGYCGQDPTPGSNQVLCNWVDQKALVVTRNPPPPTCGSPSSWTTVPATQRFSKCSCPGDFRVQPPAGYENAYEDTAGVWHLLSTQSESGPRAEPSRNRLTFQRETDALIINVPESRGTATVDIIDIAGRLISRTTGSGSVRIALPSAPRSTVILHVSGRHGAAWTGIAILTTLRTQRVVVVK